MKQIQIKLSGMTCTGCETRIEKGLRSAKGVLEAKARYKDSSLQLVYDETKINMDQIEAMLNKLDYFLVKEPQKGLSASKGKSNSLKAVGAIIILFALYLILNSLGVFNAFNVFPQAGKNTGLVMLFVIGLFTSVHCMAMCGGINISQCVPRATDTADQTKKSNLRPSLLYNLGRVISYTVIGGVVGAIGSVISFSGAAKGMIQIIAGVFMVLMGLNLLNLFPALRRFVPHMPRAFVKKISAKKAHSNSPFYVGLLNGLMPCGPLQTMQIYALSTGSALAGASSMLLFSLGTVPLMFGLGAFSTFINRKHLSKVMTFSGALVVTLGIVMFGNGLGLSGLSVPSVQKASGISAQLNGNVQNITTNLSANAYPIFTVQKGVAVKWDLVATAGTLNGCNGAVEIPAYHIEKKLAVGDNFIEFTPTASGTISYSCWMGMIRSHITVVDSLTLNPSSNEPSSSNPTSSETSFTSNEVPSTGSASGALASVAKATVSTGGQTVHTTMPGGNYQPIVVQEGIPVTWTITAQQKDFISCNTGIYNNDFGLAKELKVGDNRITFTPTQTGTFVYSCSMGMFTSTITVVKDIQNITAQDEANYNSVADHSTSTGGGCCGIR